MNKFNFSKLFYLVLISVLFTACNKESSAETESATSKTETTTGIKSPKEMVAKKWHVEEVELGDAEMKGIPEEAKIFAKQMYSKMEMEFNADGTGKMSFPGMETQSGKWTISEDGKTLNIINEKIGKQEPATIEKLTENELVLIIRADGKPVKLFLKG